eukprot:Pompholyxophrys_punicea_v1_NODE_717_length_1402_cov_34.258902.p1 type:complete len:239 gc:universal NODE_717_length_1402_cov_34.258902:942-226(-)
MLVCVFAPLKTLLRDSFKKWVEKYSGLSFKRQYFFALVRSPWKAAHSPENIRGAFSKCGIWPLDVQLLQKINTRCADSFNKKTDPTFSSMAVWLNAHPEDEERLDELSSRLDLSISHFPKKVLTKAEQLEAVLNFPVRAVAPNMASKTNRTDPDSPTFSRILNAPERIKRMREEEARKVEEEEEKELRKIEREQKRAKKDEEEKIKTQEQFEIFERKTFARVTLPQRSPSRYERQNYC